MQVKKDLVIGDLTTYDTFTYTGTLGGAPMTVPTSTLLESSQCDLFDCASATHSPPSAFQQALQGPLSNLVKSDPFIKAEPFIKEEPIDKFEPYGSHSSLHSYGGSFESNFTSTNCALHPFNHSQEDSSDILISEPPFFEATFETLDKVSNFSLLLNSTLVLHKHLFLIPLDFNR